MLAKGRQRGQKMRDKRKMRKKGRVTNSAAGGRKADKRKKMGDQEGCRRGEKRGDHWNIV